MSENKLKYQMSNKKTFVLAFVIGILNLFCALNFDICHLSFAQGQFAYDSKGRRNPFIPLVTSDGRLLKLDKEQAQQDLLVEGIIYDKQGRSYAIVNGSIFGIGDSVGDYQVLKIQDKKVAFIKDGIIREVEIKKEE
jgi:hypothetical protein